MFMKDEIFYGELKIQVCIQHTIYRDIEVYWRAEFVVSLPQFFSQSCLGRPSADWLAQAGLREKSWKRNNKLSSPLHFNVSIYGVFDFCLFLSLNRKYSLQMVSRGIQVRGSH